jgi:hypothetical protein
MPDSKSVTKDDQSIEAGDVRARDEAELARMGYMQELKCVQSDLFFLSSFEVYDICPPPGVI